MGLWTQLQARLFGHDAESGDEPRSEAPPGTPAPVDNMESTPVLGADAAPVDAEATPAETPSEPISTAELDPSVVSARQERAASRILEDERLRGDLADDEFQPLLDWALRVTERLAASTAGQADAGADTTVDAGLDAIREVVVAVGAAIVAHNEGDSTRRAAELRFAVEHWCTFPVEGIADCANGERLEALAVRLDAESGLSGPEVAALIAAALQSPQRSDPVDSPSPSQAGGGRGAVGIKGSHGGAEGDSQP